MERKLFSGSRKLYQLMNCKLKLKFRFICVRFYCILILIVFKLVDHPCQIIKLMELTAYRKNWLRHHFSSVSHDTWHIRPIRHRCRSLPRRRQLFHYKSYIQIQHLYRYPSFLSYIMYSQST